MNWWFFLSPYEPTRALYVTSVRRYRSVLLSWFPQPLAPSEPAASSLFARHSPPHPIHTYNPTQSSSASSVRRLPVATRSARTPPLAMPLLSTSKHSSHHNRPPSDSCMTACRITIATTANAKLNTHLQSLKPARRYKNFTHAPDVRIVRIIDSYDLLHHSDTPGPHRPSGNLRHPCPTCSVMHCTAHGDSPSPSSGNRRRPPCSNTSERPLGEMRYWMEGCG